MDALRSFTSNNRGMLMNGVYIAAFLVVLFYLYKFLIEGSDLEVTLLNTEVDANTPLSYLIPAKEDLRVKTGGEYTLSFWMFITSWDYRAGLPKSVLQIYDANLVGPSSGSSLLTTIVTHCKALAFRVTGQKKISRATNTMEIDITHSKSRPST
jgi:hypothetical protein